MTITPHSPPSSGSLPSIAAAASRSTLKVPIRLIVIVMRNGSNWCAPRLPAIFSAQPTPAQQTEIADALGHRGLDLLGLGDVAAHEAGAELPAERLAASPR